MKWKSACGAPLTDQNLHYLACKAFRNNNLPQSMDEINNKLYSPTTINEETESQLKRSSTINNIGDVDGRESVFDIFQQ